MKINKKLSKKMQDCALEQYPNEACGVVAVNRETKKMDFFVCKNTSQTPLDNFVISVSDLQAIEDENELAAIWHSHPNAESLFSEFDKIACEKYGVTWIVMGVKRVDGVLTVKEPSFIEPSINDATSYVGRPYSYGVHDCFTIMVDYYKREFGISIDFRAEGYPQVNWIQNDGTVLQDNFENCGFVRVTDGSIEVGDVFLMEIGSSNPNHIAIYCGENVILHHINGRLSCYDKYFDTHWQERTLVKLRHKDVEANK